MVSLIDKDGSYKDQKKYNAVNEELKLRTPFFEILHEDSDESIPALMLRIEALEQDVKRLKRHKHDIKTNDVLIRI